MCRVFFRMNVIVALLFSAWAHAQVQGPSLNIVPALQLLGAPNPDAAPPPRCLKGLAAMRRAYSPTACRNGSDLINGICYGPCSNNSTAWGLYCIAKFPNKGVMPRMADGSLCKQQYEAFAGACYEFCPPNLITYGNQCRRPCPKNLLDCGGPFCATSKTGCDVPIPTPTQSVGLLNLPPKEPPGFPSEKAKRLQSEQTPDCPY